MTYTFCVRKINAMTTLQEQCNLVITHDIDYYNIYIQNTSTSVPTSEVIITFDTPIPSSHRPRAYGSGTCYVTYSNIINSSMVTGLKIVNINPGCTVTVTASNSYTVPLHGTVVTENNCSGDTVF